MDFQEELERLIGDDEERDFADQIEDLDLFDGKKININSLTPDIAFRILKLSDKQYYFLQVYIDQYGYLLTVYELLAVDSFGRADFFRLLPFITAELPIKQKTSFSRFFYPIKQEILLRYGQVLENKQGYDKTRKTHYLGTPQHLLFRYKFTSKHVNFALSAEKDPGEEFFKGSSKQGFDHYAFFLNVKDVGTLKILTIGNFRVGFGQGLIAGSGLMSGKGSSAVNIRKFPAGITSAAPMNESDPLMGIATTIGNQKFSGILFYGHRFFDGKIAEIEEEYYFENVLSVHGFHRSESEIEKRHSLMQHVWGAGFRYQGVLLKMGIQGVASHFTKEILPKEEPYRLYAFSGKDSYNVSLDYQLLAGKVVLFGEAALGNGFAPAVLQGALFQLDSRFRFSALFRYYHPQYVGLLANAFREGTSVQNETGFYLVADLISKKGLEMSLYSDIYHFVWLRYLVDKPSTGFDFGYSIKKSITRNFSFSIAYQYKNKEQNGADNPYYKEIVTYNRHKLRCRIDYKPFSNITLKTEIRTAFNQFVKSDFKFGYLLFQDVQVSFPKINLSAKARLAYFDTDSYEERLYAYEDDLLYTFNITGYYYRGWRYFLLLKYRFRFFDLSFKLSQTHYTNRTTISSGLELIEKPHKTEIKVQVVVRL
jgi:hypothetical protein